MRSRSNPVQNANATATVSPVVAVRPVGLAPAQVRLIEQLTPAQRRAVLELLKRSLADLGSEIQSVSVIARGPEGDVEVIVLTHTQDPSLESRLLEMVVDITVETGVYLAVRWFGRQEFDTFARLKIPAVERLRRSSVELYGRES